MTAFFEKSHKNTRTQIKKEPAGSFLFGYRRRTRTHVNATVRWTVATRRFRRVLHNVLESGHRHHRPKSLILQGFWAFSFASGNCQSATIVEKFYQIFYHFSFFSLSTPRNWASICANANVFRSLILCVYISVVVSCA